VRAKAMKARDGSVIVKDWGMYDEIIEMLLAAGYFRVRISGLTEFDKVIGGLCWCIVNSLENLDVDIFFQENPTIGQKIRISESVVAALQKMECYYSLEPHQIQGEDFKAIYHVIQWLVKKVMAVRSESTARLFSEAFFDKSHIHPKDTEFADTQEKEALPFVRRLKTTYTKANRRFRRTEKIDFASEEAHVQYVMLEYGDHGGAGGGAAGGAAGKAGGGGADGDSDATRAGLTNLKNLLSQGAGGENEAEEQDEEEEDVEEDLIDDEMRAKLAGAKNAGKVSGREIGGLVEAGSDAIRAAANDYAMSQEDSETLQARLAGGLAEANQRQIASLQKQCETAESRHDKLKEMDGGLQDEVNELLAELKRRGEENEQMTDELTQMETMKTDANKVDLDRLRALVVLNESFKQQEAKFKESCKAQRNTLVAKIEATVPGSDQSSEEEERLRQIEEVYEKDLAKFTRVRQMLAEKNRQVAFVQRRIEEVPTRTELTQYERRFVELYEQVASKLDETRKYFDTFNNLTDRRTFYGQELDLMNQIYNQYTQIAGDKGKKENYIREMTRIKGDIEVSVGKIRNKVEVSTASRDTLHDRYNALQEQQRAYFKACREFQEECDKNEYLLSLKEGGE